MPSNDVQFEVQLTETGKGQQTGGGPAPGTPSPPGGGEGGPKPPSGQGMGASFQQFMGNMMQQRGAEALPSVASAGVTSATGSPTLGSLAGIGAGSLAASSLAGPLGIGAMAALIVSEINNKITEVLGGGLRTLADISTSPYRSGPEQMLLGSMSKATGLMDPLEALTGINLNPLDDSIRILIESIQTVISNFDALGEKMAEFSGPVAVAQAEREIAQLQTEIYRAQKLGPDMAEYIRARTETAERWERLKIDIQEAILPILTQIVQLLGQGVDAVSATIQAWNDVPVAIKTMLKALAPGNPVVQLILELLDTIARNTEPSTAEDAWKANEEYRRKLQEFLDPASMFGDETSAYTPPTAPPRKSSTPKTPYGVPLSGSGGGP